MKKIMITVLLLISVLALSACKKSNDNNAANGNSTTNDSNPTATVTVAPTSALSGKELTVGILPAESAIPIIIAKEKGFFDENGVTVTIKAFSSPNDRNVAIQANELNATIADVMTEATFKENGINMKITSDINEDFKILSSPKSGITDMKGLSGKKVSLVKNFILEYIMDQFAKENNFTYEIVEIPSFSGRSEALMSNQIDGVVFTEPQAGMLVQQGAHLLGSSKDAGIKGGTILFTDDMIHNRPADIKAFYQAYNKAIEYMNTTDPSEYSGILTNYQFPEAISAYLTTLKGSIKSAGVIDNDQFESIINWTKDKGLIKNAYTYADLTDFSFIK